MVKDHLSPPLIPSKLNGRKMELALIVECRGVLDRIITGLKTDTQREAARIAGMVMDIRGYGQVMQQSVDKSARRNRQGMSENNFCCFDSAWQAHRASAKPRGVLRFS